MSASPALGPDRLRRTVHYMAPEVGSGITTARSTSTRWGHPVRDAAPPRAVHRANDGRVLMKHLTPARKWTTARAVPARHPQARSPRIRRTLSDGERDDHGGVRGAISTDPWRHSSRPASSTVRPGARSGRGWPSGGYTGGGRGGRAARHGQQQRRRIRPPPVIPQPLTAAAGGAVRPLARSPSACAIDRLADGSTRRASGASSRGRVRRGHWRNA